MSTRRPRQQGFTLLELLVAITLLGVLMAALFGALRLGARVWETGEQRLDASARIQVVQDFLRQQLGQTVPLTEIASEPRHRGAMLFVGESEALRFVSLLPAHLGGGASILELALRQPAAAGAQRDLVLRMQPLDLAGDSAAPAAPEERVLIEGIERLELAYFGAERPDAAPIWWQQWRDRRSLPTLVRMRVAFPPDDRRRWPELIAALMVDMPPPFQL